MPLVMIVDDDADVRGALAEVLDDHGYTTLTAANGREALELLLGATRLPDLLLLDLFMPEMDGPSLLLRLADDPRLAALPVVILSARRNAEELVAPSRVAGCLEKPMRISQLLEIVESTLAPERVTTRRRA